MGIENAHRSKNLRNGGLQHFVLSIVPISYHKYIEFPNFSYLTYYATIFLIPPPILVQKGGVPCGNTALLTVSFVRQ